jgi:hypothetical protein
MLLRAKNTIQQFSNHHRFLLGAPAPKNSFLGGITLRNPVEAVDYKVDLTKKPFGAISIQQTPPPATLRDGRKFSFALNVPGSFYRKIISPNKFVRTPFDRTSFDRTVSWPNAF